MLQRHSRSRRKLTSVEVNVEVRILLGGVGGRSQISVEHRTTSVQSPPYDASPHYVVERQPSEYRRTHFIA